MRAVRGVLLACCGMHVASCVADSVYSIMASHSMLPLRAMVSRPVSACVLCRQHLPIFQFYFFSHVCVWWGGDPGSGSGSVGRGLVGARAHALRTLPTRSRAARSRESDDSPRAATSTFYTF